MKNKVYYGEYSLNYWIELMLKSDITMPEYQRRYVWTKEQVEKLLNSMKNNEFIPPVIIGSCKQNGDTYNYIIDGQQRLTAILFAKIGYIIDPKAWEKETELLLSSSLNEEDDEDIEYIKNTSVLWRYPNLLAPHSKNNTIYSIIETCKKDKRYQVFDWKCDDDFFEKTYLGFSYLLPQDDNEIEQHKYYSTIFRNINFQGTELQAEESREALYFWNKERTFWFKPDFAEKIKGKTKSGVAHMDFVRYVSILSNYHKLNCNKDAIFKGYKLIWEQYYDQYIYSVAQDADDPRFGKYSSLYKNDKAAAELLNKTSQVITDLGLESRSYDTIIKMDIYFFGLLYYQLFKKEYSVDISNKSELEKQLEEKWQSYDDKHKRAPGAKKYLRDRIYDSIEIYSKFLKKNE